MHAPCDGKSDEVKGNFCEQLERVLELFSSTIRKNLLGYFNEKVGWRYFETDNLEREFAKLCNDSGDRVLNVSISKNFFVKMQYPLITKLINTSGTHLRERYATRLNTFLFVEYGIRVYLA